jgi:hypothetical protein
MKLRKFSIIKILTADIKEDNFSIYPLPANERINIQFGDNAKGTINLTITDVTGRVIYSGEYSDARPGQEYSINSSTLLGACICLM